MADTQAFRRAWGKFPTGVAVVTTVQSDGHVHGMSANGISSVSLDPMLVLFCVGHNRNTYPLIRAARRFAINFLGEAQRPVGEYYARPPEQRKGDVHVNFSYTANGAAIIDGCLASMDCRVVNEYLAGDHTIFIGEVEDIQVGAGMPLVFYEGKFGRLGGDSFPR